MVVTITEPPQTQTETETKKKNIKRKSSSKIAKICDECLQKKFVVIQCSCCKREFCLEHFPKENHGCRLSKSNQEELRLKRNEFYEPNLEKKEME